MFSLITEMALRATWWALYKTYNGLYYVYYGSYPETPESLVNKQLNGMENAMDKIEHENQDLLRKIDELETLIKYQGRNINESKSLSSPGDQCQGQSTGNNQ